MDQGKFSLESPGASRQEARVKVLGVTSDESRLPAVGLLSHLTVLPQQLLYKGHLGYTHNGISSYCTTALLAGRELSCAMDRVCRNAASPRLPIVRVTLMA